MDSCFALMLVVFSVSTVVYADSLSGKDNYLKLKVNLLKQMVS